MKYGRADSDAAIAVLIRDSRGQSIDATVVRHREGRVTVAIGVGKARTWKVGDRVEVAAPDAATRIGGAGRIYSIYKALSLDYVMIDFEDVRGAANVAAMRRRDLRSSTRHTPLPARPILAVLLVGDAAIEGRVRNLSIDGMALYVRGGGDPMPSGSGDSTVVFGLPGALQN